MILCQPECPNRTLHCHRKCQEYLKKKILQDLRSKAAQKEMDKLAFIASSRKAVAKISRRAKNKQKGRIKYEG